MKDKHLSQSAGLLIDQKTLACGATNVSIVLRTEGSRTLSFF